MHVPFSYPSGTVSLTLAVLLFTLGGCGKNEVQRDLREYTTSSLPPLREIERNALAKYETVSGEHYVDDAVLYETIRSEVLPLFRELLLHAEAVVPASPDVRRLHDAYLASARRYRSAFTLYLEALEKQDAQHEAVALRELEEAAHLSREFSLMLHASCEEYHLPRE
ncbi:MAG: hypothetical protein QHI48_03785 [Bacteroidota bacterium]|nr:hypothetical protein [Bacteroidota bacterium]